MKQITQIMLSLTMLIIFVGCVSTPVHMDVDENRNYTVLGKGEGTAGGFMLLQFIPIKHNDRYQRAYNQAISQLHGDAMINPHISERWYWAYIGNGYVTTVSGDVIKYQD